MSTYIISPPDDTPSSHLSRIGKNPLFYEWWRVAAEDGSTVALVPDELIARRIADRLSEPFYRPDRILHGTVMR